MHIVGPLRTMPLVAVDLGGTSIRAALVVGGQLLARVQRATPAKEGPDAVVTAIAEAVHEAIGALSAGAAKPIALGIAAPGPLNGPAGVVYSPPNLAGWRDVPLRALLENRLGLPTHLIKDTNAAALAEHRFGAGRGTQNMIYLTISTGIGGGLILNGDLFQGGNGTAGEVGHVTVDQFGPVCNCGNVGCIEAVASGAALARIAAERIAAGHMAPPQGNLTPSAALVIAAAQAGDEQALTLVQGAGRALGLACVGLAHLFNPEVIVLGGGMAHAGELLMDPLHAAIRAHTMAAPKAHLRIVPADLGDDVGIWGAALHASEGESGKGNRE